MFSCPGNDLHLPVTVHEPRERGYYNTYIIVFKLKPGGLVQKYPIPMTGSSHWSVSKFNQLTK